MDLNLFYRLSAPFEFAIIAVVLMIASSIGLAIGHYARTRGGEEGPTGTIQASVLGLLALMLGFTFAAASARFDARRQLVVEEANSLGTTLLRSQMLPEPYRTRMLQILPRYIDLRVDIGSAYGRNPEKVRKMMGETEDLQRRMWEQAEGAAKTDPSVITALFVETLNDSIDLYSSRVAAFRTRVPETILWILGSISVVGLALTGYVTGVAGRRNWLVMAVLSVIVAAVIVMIVDLDRPVVGPTRVSQQSLEDLRKSLPEFPR